MGESACWLDRVCDGCGRVDDDLDDERRCRACAEARTDSTASAERDALGDDHPQVTDGSASTRW